MIELVTGLPGNGKTLMTIGQVRERAERENRPVFYNGIPELTLPGWELLEDPKAWASVPPRSIVLLDEGQKTFRNRSVSAQPPSFVTDLETHRHLGIDLVIITQHPSLIDPSVRRLAGRHQHCIRIWGMEASTVHKWDSVKDNCDKSRADSQKSKYVFDKKLYGVYKSAEVHTMKRSIPTRVKMLAMAPLVIGLLGYYVYTTMHKASHPEVQRGGVQVNSAGSLAPGGAGTGGYAGNYVKPPFDPVADARNYVAMNTPRITGLPQTAPKYDQLTTPVRVPVPAMCVQIGKASTGKRISCKCYTQQGTPMPVQLDMCIDMAQNGFFQDFDAERDKGGKAAEARPSAAGSVPANEPRPSSSQVLAMSEVQDPPKPKIAKLDWGH